MARTGKIICQDHIPIFHFLVPHFRLLVLIALYIRISASLNLGQRSSCDRVLDGTMHPDKVKTEPNKSRVDPSIEMRSSSLEGTEPLASPATSPHHGWYQWGNSWGTLSELRNVEDW